MKLIAEIEGDLAFFESEGGFAPSSIEIDGDDLEAWLAEKLGLPVTERGNVDQGTHGEIILRIYRR